MAFEAAAPPIRRTESHLRGGEGRGRSPLLFRRAWLPPDPWAALLVVHGYAEHSGRYEDLGAWFAARGLAVHAYDHRGHGRSEGTRCHVDRFDELLDDADRMLERVRGEHPELPIALLGHSMGGLVVAAFLADRRPPVAAAVTSGAALAVGPGVSRARVAAARLVRRLAPRLALGSGLDPAGLSRDPEVVRRYVEDPLVYRTMTSSLAVELLAAIPRVAARAVEVQVPVLLLHGSEDPLCPIEGSRAFHGGVRVPGSAFRAYPGLRHEIFNEPEREQVFADLLAWLRPAVRPEASARAAR
jgi:alpha-beta hydrolase superfamily lysophospholipase